MKPTWKNTLNWESNATWSSLQIFVSAIQSVGYTFGVWHDDKVYSFSEDKVAGFIVEPTSFNRFNVEQNTAQEFLVK